MDSIGYVLLGVIAAGSLAQAAVMVRVLVGIGQLAAEMGARIDSLEQELRPQLLRLGEAAEGLSRLTGSVQTRMPGIASALDDAGTSVRRTGEAVERVVHRPVGLLAAALVFTVARRYLAHRGGRP